MHESTTILRHPATARLMEQTLPRHLTHHDALTAAQTAYLEGVTGRHNCRYHAELVTAVLAAAVDGYHAEPGALTNWQQSARTLLESAFTELHDGPTRRLAHETLQLAIAGYRPAKALNVLVRLQVLHLQAARAAALACVATADAFFATRNAAA